jgi:hypothetical protein
MEQSAKLIQLYWRKKKYSNRKKEKLAVLIDIDRTHIVFLYKEELSSGLLKAIYVRVFSIPKSKFYTEVFEINELFTDRITIPIFTFKQKDNLEYVVETITSIINMIQDDTNREGKEESVRKLDILNKSSSNKDKEDIPSKYNDFDDIEKSISIAEDFE